MKEAAVLYYSQHHGNTRKLLDSVKEKYNIDLIDIKDQETFDIKEYRRIGFASGIYMGKVYKGISQFVEKHQEELSGKRVFLILTSGSKNKKYEIQFGEELFHTGAIVDGSFQCYGYDTYGPFKLFGGIRRNHPNQKECKEAAEFYKSLSCLEYSCK